MTFRFAPILLNNARTSSLSRRLFTLGVGAILLTGCALHYQSHIRMPDGTELWMPKDARGDAMVLHREYTDAAGRTNRIYFYMTNFAFKMNEAILDKVTAHDVAVINATAAGVGKLIGEGAKAAAGVP